jgi:hypothetical protein
VPQRGAARADVAQRLQQVRRGDQRDGAAVLQDVVDLAGRVVGDDRHVDGTEAHGAEPRVQVLGPVAHEHGDAVAEADPQVVQPARHARDGLVEPPEADDVVVEEEIRRGWVDGRLAGEEPADRVVRRQRHCGTRRAS